MYENIFGRIYWLRLKRKPKKLGKEKANFPLNIFVMLCCIMLHYILLLYYVYHGMLCHCDKKLNMRSTFLTTG